MAWQKSRYFATSPLVSPYLLTCFYPDLCCAFDWLKQISLAPRPIRSTAQVSVVTHYQYGIFALVSQTSFGGKTSGDVTKCLPSVASVSVRFRSKTENSVLRSFFAPKPNGNACYAGYEMFGCFLSLAKLLCHISSVIMSFFHFETYCGMFDLFSCRSPC